MKNYMKCPKCNGQGSVEIKEEERDHPGNKFKRCTHCFGDKDLDWIDCILGISWDEHIKRLNESVKKKT